MTCVSKKQCYAMCKDYGFFGVQNNLYRCYGDGLLQVISLPKKSRSASIADDLNQVHFGIFSLYSKLPWLPSGQIAKMVGCDLPVSWDPFMFFRGIRNHVESEGSMQIVFDEIIPCLDALLTHAQLADLQERYDMFESLQIRVNDSNKIVPYLLSKQSEKAIKSITAIEEQNWSAYQQNCRCDLNYDKDANRRRIMVQLAPLMALREALYLKDHATISEYLIVNYQYNIDRLQSLGVNVDRATETVVLSQWLDI